MRGRSTSAKARLRSAGYKCNLCGRRLIDAATLERHQKTIHKVSPRNNKLGLKPKPHSQRNKLTHKNKEKVFDDLVREEILVESKLKLRNSKRNYENVRDTTMEGLADASKISSKNIDIVKNGESLSVDNENTNKKKDVTRRVEFECPVCAKTYSAYFNAHKHIQKVHSVNADGKKVPLNSPDLVQPIRVEQCNRCDNKIRSTEHHTCTQIVEEHITVIAEFICSGCNQIFVSLKSFDMHVAGVHSDAVDSMFFPSKIEFMNWRLEMERQTNAKYSLYGEYESKKIYRCNYARNHADKDKYTAYFCPSSIVVQEFSKGIQVHFYNKHYDHTANLYTLSSKYKKYAITSFLQYSNEDDSVPAAYSGKVDDKDLYSQFKKLMDSIILHAADIDVSVLKMLIEKALEMSTVVTEAEASETMSISHFAKNMTDQEITEALEMKTVLHKRRRSVDSCEALPKPAKRMRNKSLFTQSDTKLSPKILNTFSLASHPNSDELRSDNGNAFVLESSIEDNNDKIESIQTKTSKEPDTKTNKSTKINTRLTSFNESLSFNDSYKDFIDKNFIGKETRLTRNLVKTKLGAFKQTSPRKVEIKEDISVNIANNKNMRGVKPITSVSSKGEEAPVSKMNTITMETPKSSSPIVDIPNVTITKVSSIRKDTAKGRNVQTNALKADTPKLKPSKVNNRSVFTHLVDPVHMNITKAKRGGSSSPVESSRGNVSKVDSGSVSSPLADPLELDIVKVKSKNVTSSGESLQRNNPFKVSSAKVNTSKTDTSKLTPKVEASQVHTISMDPLTPNSPKVNTPKVYTGPGSPKVSSSVVTKTPKIVFKDKVSPRITFEDKATYSNAKITTPKRKITEFKYEVREQENDCNILVLKF